MVQELINRDYDVLGIDNFNDFYNPQLKKDRIQNFAVNADNFQNIKADIADTHLVNDIFRNFNPDFVFHLAAQAGVTYSRDNPHEYIRSNISGFVNILEACRKFNVDNILYASSSSVYANNKKVPFSEIDPVDNPVSLYAATKKTNELLANVYSDMYKLNTIGLRFFTVYGPWGRPDMAIFKFTDAIFRNKPIQIFNNGNHFRDFTFINDIKNGVFLVFDNMLNNSDTLADEINFDNKIYNIGNSNPVNLLDLINLLETIIGKKSIREYQGLQKGDVLKTYADISKIQDKFNYMPLTKIEDGLEIFVKWFKEYYKL